MSLARDTGVLWALLRGQPNAGSHAERLNGFYGPQAERYDHFRERLLHGEAISIGMALAFEYSVEHGDCGSADAERAIAHFASVGLPVTLSQVPGDLPGADGLLELMTQDKKMERGAMTLILAHGIGNAYVARNVDMAALAAFLKRKRN